MKWRDLRGHSAQRPADAPSCSAGRNSGQRVREMAKSDPYALLNVARGADLSEIKKAYRGMVRTYHPDHADPFMRPYCAEVLKIINRAMAHIEREYRNGPAR